MGKEGGGPETRGGKWRGGGEAERRREKRGQLALPLAPTVGCCCGSPADALGSGLLGVGNGKSPPIISWGKGSVEYDGVSPEGGGRVNTGSPHIIFLKIKCSELNL